MVLIYKLTQVLISIAFLYLENSTLSNQGKIGDVFLKYLAISEGLRSFTQRVEVRWMFPQIPLNVSMSTVTYW